MQRVILQDFRCLHSLSEYFSSALHFDVYLRRDLQQVLSYDSNNCWPAKAYLNAHKQEKKTTVENVLLGISA